MHAHLLSEQPCSNLAVRGTLSGQMYARTFGRYHPLANAKASQQHPFIIPCVDVLPLPYPHSQITLHLRSVRTCVMRMVHPTADCSFACSLCQWCCAESTNGWRMHPHRGVEGPPIPRAGWKCFLAGLILCDLLGECSFRHTEWHRDVRGFCL